MIKSARTLSVATSLVSFFATGLLLATSQNETPLQTEDINGREEIEAFNKNYLEAHRKMDNAAILATWAEDGVSLLPLTAPIIGKAAIDKFLTEVTAQLAGYRMETIEMDFQGLEVDGNWASEWAVEHQRVQPPDGKAVIDSYGKMLLVLHREPSGRWLVKREMWNQGQKP